MLRRPSPNVVPRLESAIATGLLLGLVPHLFGAEWWVMLATFVVISFWVYVTGPGSDVLAGLPVALAVGSIGVLVLGRIVTVFHVHAGYLLAVMMVVWLLLATVLTRAQHADVGRPLLALPSAGAVTALVALLNMNARSWTAEQGFGILTSNGEDNAAWLLALSHSVDGGNTVLTPLSGTSGGSSTALFVVVWRQVMHLISPSEVSVNADNGLVLVRMYPLIATLCAILACLAVSARIREGSRLLVATSTFVSGLAAYAMVMGFATVGHMSAAVAVFFLLAAVVTSQYFASLAIVNRWWCDACVALLLVAAGQAWFPLTLLVFGFLSARVTEVGWRRLRREPQLFTQTLIVLGVLTAGAIFIMLARFLFPEFVSNVVSLDYVKRSLTLAGGYPTMSQWVAVFAIIAPLFLLAEHTPSIRNTRYLWVVVTVTVPPVGLFVWSYFLAPYTPQYGAWKYLYVAVAVLLPISCVEFVRSAVGKISTRSILLVPFAFALFLALFTPPLTNANWSATVGQTRYEWIDPIVRELRTDPTRPVGCLNTLKDDQTQNYAAYLCSRMAFGLGGFDDIHHRVWTAANLCAAPPEQVKSEWTNERQENLTVILFDGTRASSNAGCQTGAPPFRRGWLTPVDLSVMKLLDINGNDARIRG